MATNESAMTAYGAAKVKTKVEASNLAADVAGLLSGYGDLMPERVRTGLQTGLERLRAAEREEDAAFWRAFGPVDEAQAEQRAQAEEQRESDECELRAQRDEAFAQVGA